jgi:NAD(P)-dependent dehydrogenase (short-subunit alcohol dehydrogenase family)
MASNRTVALVSGANRGIGEEIARQLASDHDYLVLAGSRDPSKVEESDAIRALQLDVGDQASVDAARERVESDLGRLDVLVNNAGIYGDHESVGEYQLGRAHEVLETNTFGAWRLTQAMLPLLRLSGHGRIVNVSSGAGQLTEMNGGSAAYRVSKSGLNALTRILAEDEAGHGILANSLCPGWVRTDMGGRGARKSVEEGADTAVWLATLPEDGPTGGFFRDREPIPW